ncbi:MAG: aminotransferase class I/II-fold pyridoxal phosphate-dependent enzyme [Inquilinus limosus]|uniref:Aminotransferase class I/II-fold pyridoxal phosphate-dependent enzyme n=1 Tax=Inquilinus limosus TaxID=171674 RepID=A0A952FTV0_9PROT|nr:aminotransferase class I/II-fold pyridoxal phosphate-dependent enzyme [Inquilinus limosus]
MSLPEFALEAYFARWEFTARHNLCASDMESLTLTDLLALGTPQQREAWDRLWLGYTETAGAPTLRAAIAGMYAGLEADDVAVTVGAGEAIFQSVRALLGPDDHAVTLIPNYQSLEAVAASVCAVTGVPLDPAPGSEYGWSLDPDRIAAALRPNTRLIILNVPHNPTGWLPPRPVFNAIIEHARSRGIWILSDEVYRGLERREEERLPPAVELYERALSVGVLSKTYGLPGLRLGWVACRDRELLRRIVRQKDYTTLCAPAPSEALGEIAIGARDHLVARSRALVARNLPLLQAFFARHANRFEWQVPAAGCIGYPRYLGGEGVDAFADDAVERSGVLLLPARVYRSALGPVPADRFRIGFGRADMPAALEAFEAHLSR